jgi:polyisoprenoid-binding protein YceI
VSTLATQLFSGLYQAQPTASTFGFAVRHSGVFWFRGSLPEVTATLRGDGNTLALEGSARVDSISIVEPPAMRASVLGSEFFGAERHPDVSFRSTEVRLADDGRAEVEGELTIRGITRPVAASGRYSPPRLSGFGEIAGLELRTTVDRREFGFEWQAELPGGGDAVGWEVRLDVDLLFIRADAEAGAAAGDGAEAAAAE